MKLLFFFFLKTSECTVDTHLKSIFGFIYLAGLCLFSTTVCFIVLPQQHFGLRMQTDDFCQTFVLHVHSRYNKIIDYNNSYLQHNPDIVFGLDLFCRK